MTMKASGPSKAGQVPSQCELAIQGWGTCQSQTYQSNTHLVKINYLFKIYNANFNTTVTNGLLGKIGSKDINHKLLYKCNQWFI
jgi:hypothetical protein